MVFHEITRKAISDAVERSRDIDMGLVDAQEARRTLDRLYGYDVSPVLWRKVKTGLSAGRVQSPAIRLIVQRERERMRFRAASYWDLAARHATQPAFESALVAVDGRRVATGKDFAEDGALATPDARWLDEGAARGLAERLAGRPFRVRSIERKPYRSSPKPPFMTSTLQQEGGRKLSLSAQQVMRLAQGLYERGYITYMRTDSTALSETALSAARAQVASLFGERFLPAGPRHYAKKVKNAQEAHEAIRPAGEAFRVPDELRGELSAAELRLYELIWKRTLASQMADAEGESVRLEIGAETAAGERCDFAATGRTLLFPGYLRAYVEGADDPEAALDDQESPLPSLAEGDAVPVEGVEARGHATSPPPRYTEASLVKKLEELGIGRPSTYASILGTLQARYVWKKGQALVPNWEAFAVVALMERHFGEFVDFAFTAEMEDDLDQIANGEREKLAFLREFYFGDRKHPGLEREVKENLAKIDAADINSIPIGKDPDGVEIVVKPGRYGPYLRRGEDTVSVPEALPPDELTVEKALQLLSAPKGDRPIGTDPASGLPVYVKQGRFGPYVQLGEAGGKEKPRTQSLFRTMRPETLTLEQALSLLQLPRSLGVAPDGQEVLAQNGKFGPYLTKGTDSRNLGAESEERLLTITLGEALEIFAQPKTFRGRGAPRPPLASFGKDPVSGREMVLKEGRFGPYVTDGETNASLRRGDDPRELTPERAAELLAQRREYDASPEGQERAARRGARRKGPAGRAGAGGRKKAVAAAQAGPGDGVAEGAKRPARAPRAATTRRTPARRGAAAAPGAGRPAGAGGRKGASRARKGSGKPGAPGRGTPRAAKP
jgi:DNA topoisomerase-1